MNNSSKSFTAESRNILDSIRRLVQSIRLASLDSEKRIGLSAAQLFVLHKLGEEEGLSINELAERTLTHQSSVSVVVQKLAKKKLIARSRSAADGRQSVISLTKKGRGLLKKAPHAVQDNLIEAMKLMKPLSRRRLSDSLKEFLTKTGISDTAVPLLFDEANTKKRKKK